MNYLPKGWQWSGGAPGMGALETSGGKGQQLSGRTHAITDRAELEALDRETKQRLAELLDEWRQSTDSARLEELDAAVTEAATRVAFIAAALLEAA